jgi:DNA-3-methyladenine glycosylase
VAAGIAERRRLTAGLLQPSTEAARFLLGQILVRRIGRRAVAVRIVETEAYLGVNDPAAHAFNGRTPRNAPVWMAPGTVYVYFIYGMYYCLNIAAEPEGTAGCVLIRAAEPLPGSGLGPLDGQGPGRLCRALGIDRRLSGRSVFEARSGLFLREGRPPDAIGVSRRVGIRRAVEEPLRFFDRASAAVSPHPRPRSGRIA